MHETSIRIENARSHNLRGVSCAIPLNALTVVTGVSGSGKSTLAFDTLYGEGQRRYVTSLSTYARQFLERLPRPDVDFISNLPPAIAIEQRNTVRNARSTVGTASEILDHLRLLYAKVGETRCPDCGTPARPGGVSAVSERIVERFEGRRLMIAAPLIADKGEPFGARRDRLLREGFARLLSADGEVVDLEGLSASALKGHWRSALLLIDRLVPRATEARARLSEAVGAAFQRGDGRLVVVEGSGRGEGEARRSEYQEGFSCDGCGRGFDAPSPALFSFNSPLGACETCSGFGRTQSVDWRRVVPDESLSLEDDAIVPFATPMGRSMQTDLLEACEAEGIPGDRPFFELTAAQREFVLEGGDEWYGVRGWFDWLEDRRYRVQARIQLARYRRFDECEDCGGGRLRPESGWVWLGDRRIIDLCRMSIAELRAWLDVLELDSAAVARCERILDLTRRRLATVDEVGLGYITLDRTVRTLSGGENQRIQLATALGGSLTAVLYVLDEPSIGLHARDLARLLEVLRTIRDHGNTVVVVEHSRELIEAADHVIDLGPRAGRAGGEIVVAGRVEEVRAHPESLTGRCLRDELEEKGSRSVRSPSSWLELRGARVHNLCALDVSFPLGCLVAVTGVSGAGKSSLVHSILVANLQARLPGQNGVASDLERGACDEIRGDEALERVVVVEQSAASRGPRSNPATVSKAFEGIRKLFAETREARAAGWGPGTFSFNVAGGRCDACEGAGEVTIDMQFMDDLRVPCQECGGLRYRREVLGVTVKGRSIADVLALTIEEAHSLLAQYAKIAAALEPMIRVGLGYLTLGQPLSTLSGGEHQRMRLALALSEDVSRVLYVLDEPTTGLHAADVQVLLRCLDDLIDHGASVVVVEHNLDVIRRADHVIDLGPEGGPGGGRIVATGSPREVAGVEGSHTGAALAQLLNPES